MTLGLKILFPQPARQRRGNGSIVSPALWFAPLQISGLCGTDSHKARCARAVAREGVARESDSYIRCPVPSGHPFEPFLDTTGRVPVEGSISRPEVPALTRSRHLLASKPLSPRRLLRAFYKALSSKEITWSSVATCPVMSDARRAAKWLATTRRYS